MTFNLTFSEPVVNVDAGDFTLAATGTVTAGAVAVGDAGDADGAIWTVNVTGVAGDGVLGLDLSGYDITDSSSRALGMPPTAIAVYAIDNTLPTVTIHTAAPQAGPTNTGPVLFVVTFSDPVTGFYRSGHRPWRKHRRRRSHGHGRCALDGQVHTVTVSGVSAAGRVVVTVPDGAAVNAVGNRSAAAIGDNTVTIVGNQTTVQQFAVATSSDALKTVYGPAGGPAYSFTPITLAESPNGVRVAMADVNGDGTPDVVVGTGPGAANQVRVFDGASRAELFRVSPFESSFYTLHGQNGGLVERLELRGHERGQRRPVVGPNLPQAVPDGRRERCEVRVVLPPDRLLRDERPQPLDQVQVRRVRRPVQQRDAQPLGLGRHGRTRLIPGVVRDHRPGACPNPGHLSQQLDHRVRGHPGVIPDRDQRPGDRVPRPRDVEPTPARRPADEHPDHGPDAPHERPRDDVGRVHEPYRPRPGRGLGESGFEFLAEELVLRPNVFVDRGLRREWDGPHPPPPQPETF